MFRYIKGEVAELFADRVVIENGGIGYDIMVSSITASTLRVGEYEKIYTKFIVKEDDISLIGFRSLSELTVFSHLISVSKVGPKLALAVLSAYTPEDVVRMIVISDALSLSKVSGLGKKTSERIILELKDKFKESMFAVSSQDMPSADLPSNVGAEAVQGLMGLGFSKKESEDAVTKTVDRGFVELEDILKHALMLLQKS